jgi:hypothetical protein
MCEECISRIAKANEGDILMVCRSVVMPSQVDDGHDSLSTGAIEVCIDNGRAIAVHGNHRLHRAQGSEINVRKVRNPYFG